MRCVSREIVSGGSAAIFAGSDIDFDDCLSSLQMTATPKGHLN